MALASCRECGKEVSTEARSCPHCGIERPVEKPFTPESAVLSIWIVTALAAFGLAAVGLSQLSSGNAPNSQTQNGDGQKQNEQLQSAPSRGAGVPTPALAQDQAQFGVANADAKVSYDQMDNDLKKSVVRKQRDQQAMAATNGGPFKGWTGTLKTMTTNGDGDGVIVVQLDGCPCTLRTWNNSFSDLQSHTLVKNGSLLFNKILNMRVGDRVRVSGLILQEASLSERGSVDDPEWITRFSDVSLATSTGTKATTNTAAINPAQAVATAGGGSDKSPPLSTDSEQSRVPPVQTQNAATANDAEMAAALKNAKEAWNRGDNPAAFNVFLSLANRGNAEAENDLGVMYTKGQGVTADYAEAVKWYGKAAEQGLAGAQHNLGFMYVNGWGVPQDDAEATKWFRKAGDQGNTTAQNNLGIMYQLGRGVPQDYHEAINWFRKAADLGNTDAQKNVTVAYSGNGLYGKL